MNVLKRVASVAWVAPFLLFGGVAFNACQTPVKNDTEISGFGITLKTSTDVNGDAVNTLEGTIPGGWCVKITYRGPDGGVTGSDVVDVPGSSQIPSGSTCQVLEFIECPDAHLAASGSARFRSNSIVTEIFGGPIVVDTVDGGLFKNAVYRFRVRNAASAWNEILPILIGGPGTPVPGNVEVISFTQIVPDTLGARMLVADTHPFTEFRLDLNGTFGYADLASSTNVLQYGAPNNWSVVETFLSAIDFLPFGQENVVTTTRQTQGEVGSHSLTGKVLYYP